MPAPGAGRVVVQRLRAVRERLLAPSAAFSGSGIGRLLNCLVLASLVAVATQSLHERFGEGLDAAVQGSLLQRRVPTCEPGEPGCDRVVVVEINDDEFRQVFGQRSPLDPAEIGRMVETLAAAKPAAVLIDLDLAPASDAADEQRARSRLREALLRLGAATDGRTVLACPQGYSTPAPSPQDVAWVASFAGSDAVRFGSTELDPAGLYFYRDRRPLAVLGVAGLVGEGAARGRPAADGPAADPCRSARDAARDGDGDSGGDDAGDPELIRPKVLRTVSWRVAQEHPQLLAGRVVVVGGGYGVSDRFHLRGAAAPVHGVHLHAWIAQGEFEPVRRPSFAATLWLDIGIGLLTGTLFGALWHGIRRCRGSFACRLVLYAGFLGLTVALPVALLLLAVGLAQYDVFIGSAAMIVSVVLDSMLSSHEQLLADEAPAGAAAGAAATTANVSPAGAADPSPAGGALAKAAVATAVGVGGFAALAGLEPSSATGAAALAVAVAALGAGAAVALWPQPPATSDRAAEPPRPPESRADRVAQWVWLLTKVGVVVHALREADDGRWASGVQAVALVATVVAVAAAAAAWAGRRRREPGRGSRSGGAAAAATAPGRTVLPNPLANADR